MELYIEFVPTDTKNFNIVHINANLTVLPKRIPIIEWGVPPDIVYGEKLQFGVHLNAAVLDYVEIASKFKGILKYYTIST